MSVLRFTRRVVWWLRGRYGWSSGYEFMHSDHCPRCVEPRELCSCAEKAGASLRHAPPARCQPDKDGPSVLIWEPGDSDADRLYFGFANRGDALTAALDLDRDTSGDWFIEPLQQWSEAGEVLVSAD